MVVPVNMLVPLPTVAVITEVPEVSPVTKPSYGEAGLPAMVATAGVADAQVTVVGTGKVIVPSVLMILAFKSAVWPTAIEGLSG